MLFLLFTLKRLDFMLFGIPRGRLGVREVGAELTLYTYTSHWLMSDGTRLFEPIFLPYIKRFSTKTCAPRIRISLWRQSSLGLYPCPSRRPSLL